jgi:peptidoglycan/LPS O-acetylase OafA/YrhL
MKDLGSPAGAAARHQDGYRPGHIRELDGLRGIAVILVVIHHIGQSFPGFESATLPNRLLHLWIVATRPGWLGVDIFFVLSGFLIAGLLMDAKGHPHFYRNFYMKRILRIFPLYYLILIVMLVFYGWPWHFFSLCLFFLANVSVLFHVPLVMAPLWSLSVEEHFYLALPWIIKFVRRELVFWIALILCVLEPPFRFHAFKTGYFDPYFTWFRLDGLACGVMVAYLVRNFRSDRVKKFALIFVCVATVVFAASIPFGGASRLRPVGTAFLYSCASMFMAGIVAFAAVRPGYWMLRPLRNSVLGFFGDISYCVYLIHMFVILGFYRFVQAFFRISYLGGMIHSATVAYTVHFLVVFVVCCTIGVFSRDYFEGPIRSYRVNYQ